MIRGYLDAKHIGRCDVVAASMIVDLSDRQVLLAEPDALRRLTAERALLARETNMLRRFTSTPATDLRSSPYNPN